MRILLVSPYHGGSHQAWAEGYADHGDHEVQVLSLPARFWKWRMEGGAITLARMALPVLANPATAPDLILTTDMLDLGRFLALTRPYSASIPVALYMHENQLTYPLPSAAGQGPMRHQQGARDRHFVLTNLTSMLAADRVYFNSNYHRKALFEALPPFLKHYPEYQELETLPTLVERSEVLAVGVEFARLDPAPPLTEGRPPLIVWNQRWEYDKNPEGFVEVLRALAGEGLPFEVALCGERFGLSSPELDGAVSALGERVVYDGYANDSDYRRLLWEATLTFSTAHHEYFGISMLEAMHCHTLAILPRRLSYPEIIPAAFHETCLVNENELLPRLHWALKNPPEARLLAAALASATAGFDWRQMATEYDRRFETLLALHSGRRS